MKTFLLSKIQNATVTHTDFKQTDAIVIDEALLDCAEIELCEQVHIWNVTNGSRIISIAMKGERNSGIISINGSGAHSSNPGDIVAISSFYTNKAPYNSYPIIVLLDEVFGNKTIKQITHGKCQI